MANFLLNCTEGDVLVRDATGRKHAEAVAVDQGYTLDRSVMCHWCKLDQAQAEYWTQAGMPERYNVTVLIAYDLEY